MMHSARDRPLYLIPYNDHEGGEVNIVREAYPNELMHYGIPGQKWGIRRYQNPDGTLTAAGRRRYGSVENLERGMTKKQAAEHDEAKRAAINSGKAAEVQRFSSELTREEMAHAVQRIRDEQVLSDLRAKDVAAGQQKVKAIIDAGGQLKTAGETVKSVYNLVAQANNAFNKDNKMPIIGQDSNNKKPGEKSIEQQTKEFALERMKQKAKWEDEDRANKTNNNSSDVDKNNPDNSDKSNQDRSNSSDSSKETVQAPTYSQPSQKLAPKKEVEVPKYSQPSQKLAPKKEVEVPKYSQPSQKTIDQVTKTLMQNNNMLANRISTNQSSVRSSYDAYQLAHPDSQLSFNAFEAWFKK